MSGTLEIDAGTQPTRRSRARREDREVQPAATVIEGTQETVTPEAALADSHAQLETSNRQAADARRQAQEETQRRIAAEKKLAEATTARATDRQSVVAAALEAATADKSRAATAKRLARDAGDFDAEIQADEDFAQAVYRQSNASAELDYLKANPPPKEEVQQQTESGKISEAAQRWLDAHPAFYSDEGYKSTAVGAHTSALNAGKPAGSQAYVDHIDNILTQVYGDGHGQVGTRRDNGEKQVSGRQSAASGGAPPSRGDTPARGGFKTVTMPDGLGDLYYQKGADGAMRIKFSSEDQANTFREFAQTSKMTLEEYTKDMIDAHAEGFTDIVRGDGARFE